MLRFRGIVLLFAARGALAQEPTARLPAQVAAEEVALSYYGAAAGCLSKAQFVEQIAARVSIPVMFGGTTGTVRMLVTLAPAGEQVLGKLEVERAAAEPTRREFTASSCEEVGSALALVAALALDPNARTEPLPVRAAATEATAPAAEPEKPIAPPQVAPPPTVVPPPAAPPPPHYLAWIGPVAGIVAGDAPKVVGLFGLALGVRRVSPRLFSPSLQLTPLWGKTGSTGPKTSAGEFAWAMGRLEGCPVSAVLSEYARLDPCAALEVGRLTARGADAQVAVPVPVERWWLAPGATVSLHLGFSGWFVRLSGMALFPVTRDEFVFLEPDRRVHQASPVVAGGSLGLGFQLGE
jgi:hypothetical protein